MVATDGVRVTPRRSVDNPIPGRVAARNKRIDVCIVYVSLRVRYVILFVFKGPRSKFWL